MGTLKASQLDTLEPRNKGYHDGDGLYFVKTKKGGNWIYKFTLNGRSREMGLGKYPEVGLTAARAEAARQRTIRALGKDPIEERNAVRRRGLTFEEAAREYFAIHCQHYAKPQNWIRGMEINVFPHIGRKQVADLVPDDLVKFLKPIWGQEKTRKLRQWIAAVIAHVRIDDPRVDGELMEKVANRLGPQNIEYDNHPAVPYKDIPALWLALPPTLVGLSMKMLILTGQRVAPVVLADWSEFDFKNRVWVIPPGRVKHWKYRYRVPLTRAMIDVLHTARRRFPSETLVFPSEASKSGHLSNNAHRLWLHKHEWKDEEGELASAHGLRSAFRTWMEEANPPVEWRLSEHVLQHMGSLGNQTEQAYLRGDRLEHRREVHEAWGSFVMTKAENALEVARQERDMDRQIAVEEGRAPAPMTKEEEARWYRKGLTNLDLTDDEDRTGPPPHD